MKIIKCAQHRLFECIEQDLVHLYFMKKIRKLFQPQLDKRTVVMNKLKDILFDTHIKISYICTVFCIKTHRQLFIIEEEL